MVVKAEVDLIFMLGNAKNDISSSEYLRIEHDVHHSPTPHFELEEEFELQKNVQSLIAENLVASVHDISEGGLFVTLMESGMVGDLGFDVNTDPTFRKDAYLFGEAQSRVVVSVKPRNELAFLQFLEKQNIAHTQLGKVFGSNITIDGKDFGGMSEWKNVYNNTLKNKLED